MSPIFSPSLMIWTSKELFLAWTISHGRVNFHVRLYGVRYTYLYFYSRTVAYCAKALQRVLTTYSCIVK